MQPEVRGDTNPRLESEAAMRPKQRCPKYRSLWLNGDERDRGVEMSTFVSFSKRKAAPPLLSLLAVLGGRSRFCSSYRKVALCGTVQVFTIHLTYVQRVFIVHRG